jgi:hypothetical protein
MSTVYCINCGSLIPSGQKYCPVCGNCLIEDKKLSAPAEIPASHTADTISLLDVSDADTAELTGNSAAAKTIAVEKPAPVQTEQEAEPEEKKHRNPFASIFFEEVEVDDDGNEIPAPKAEKTKNNNEDGGKKSSHVFSTILIIILAVLVGALGYLYFEKPAVLNSGLKKIGLSLPGYSTASVSSASTSASAAPTATVSPYIGKLTVSIESINIRDTYATTGNPLGKALQGSSYDVLAVQTGEGYTWYEIGENQWIADSNGEWVAYTASAKN